MSNEQTLRKVVLCVSLIFGAMIGIPMRADRVEEMLKAMNAIKSNTSFTGERSDKL